MIRRQWVSAALAAGLLCSATASPVPGATAPRSGLAGHEAGKKPRIMFYNDGRHPAIYMYEPPMQKEHFEAAVDDLVGTPVEVLVYGLGDGRTVLHDTQVGEVWGDPVEKWRHLIFRRAHQNAKMLLEKGQDPLRIVCERARATGMLIYPSLLLNRGRGEDRLYDVRAANFTWENQHLEIGSKGDLDPNFPELEKRRLDFKHEKVRNERFTLIEEVLQNYPVDGFELRFGHFHFFHPKEVDSGRAIMTAWVKRVYDAVKASGPERELVVFVPANLEAAYDLGFDLREWIRQGIVDVIVAKTYAYLLDNLADFRPLIEAARGSSVRIHAAANGIVNSDRVGSATIEMIRAMASNYWAQGVDGLYLHQWFASTNWPFQATFYEQLREVPYPQVMAPKDKFYMVTTAGPRTSLPAPLPQDLQEGQTAKVRLPIADDLPRWDRQGRIHEILFRIRLNNHTELDRVTVRLNGKVLRDSHLRKINHLYRLHAPRFRVNNSYWYIYRLDRDHWPQLGDNTIEVTLDRRDPDITPTLQLRDVEMEIRYLMGRHHYRDEDPDLGPSVRPRPFR